VLKSGFPLRRTDAPAACLISCFQSTSRVVYWRKLPPHCLYGCRYGCLRGFAIHNIHNQHVGRGGPGALLRCVNSL